HLEACRRLQSGTQPPNHQPPNWQPGGRRVVREESLLRSLLLLFCGLCICVRAQEGRTAFLAIDAAKVENAISPTLYGQFAECMFEDVKGGLYAELIRDRSFDEAPNSLGLP